MYRIVERAAFASLIALILVLAFISVSQAAPSDTTKGPRAFGFDLGNASVPVREIKPGTTGRDRIPAITEPDFVSVEEVDYLRPADLVVGVVRGAEARAYPLRILVWHEIVNDMIGTQAIAVTYCPLCGTCMVFDRLVDGKPLTLGVSGLLYNSDVLMYDRQSESLWSQIKMEAVAGPRVGTKLRWLPSKQMTWSAWKERYPRSAVLSTDTGFRRNYQQMPYDGYERVESTMFPFRNTRNELRNKEWVVGVLVGDKAKAYPVEELQALGETPLRDRVGGKEITLTFDGASSATEVYCHETGEELPHVAAYWFAWQAFYPATALYRS
jgi:uncharacterized protein DUF3179